MINILVLNYNNAQDTVECLKSILSSCTEFVNIVIIDNASTDNSVENIKSWFIANGLEVDIVSYKSSLDIFYEENYSNNSITLLSIDSNNGYASGNNIGIKYAMKSGTKDDFIWILNNDTILQNNTLENLIKSYNELKDEDIALLGSKILNNDLTVQSIGFLTQKYSDEELIYKKYVEVEHISGCSIFFKLEIIDKVGFLPEEYFLYYEETDWMKSIRQKGFKIFTSLNSSLIHKHAKSTGGIYSPFVIYYMTRNQILFNKKYFNKAKFIQFIILIVLKNISKTIYYSFKNIKIAKSIILGTVDGIFGIKGKKELL